MLALTGRGPPHPRLALSAPGDVPLRMCPIARARADQETCCFAMGAGFLRELALTDCRAETGPFALGAGFLRV